MLVFAFALTLVLLVYSPLMLVPAACFGLCSVRRACQRHFALVSFVAQVCSGRRLVFARLMVRAQSHEPLVLAMLFERFLYGCALACQEPFHHLFDGWLVLSFLLRLSQLLMPQACLLERDLRRFASSLLCPCSVLVVPLTYQGAVWLSRRLRACLSFAVAAQAFWRQPLGLALQIAGPHCLSPEVRWRFAGSEAPRRFVLGVFLLSWLARHQ